MSQQLEQILPKKIAYWPHDWVLHHVVQLKCFHYKINKKLFTNLLTLYNFLFKPTIQTGYLYVYHFRYSSIHYMQVATDPFGSNFGNSMTTCLNINSKDWTKNLMQYANNAEVLVNLQTPESVMPGFHFPTFIWMLAVRYHSVHTTFLSFKLWWNWNFHQTCNYLSGKHAAFGICLERKWTENGNNPCSYQQFSETIRQTYNLTILED